MMFKCMLQTTTLSARIMLADSLPSVSTIHLLRQRVFLSLGLLKLPSYPDALLMLGRMQPAADTP